MAFKAFSVRSTPSGCSDYHYGICEALGERGYRERYPMRTLKKSILEIDSNDNTAVYSKKAFVRAKNAVLAGWGLGFHYKFCG